MVVENTLGKKDAYTVELKRVRLGSLPTQSY